MDLKFEELQISSLNSATNYFGGQNRPKGQHRPMVNNFGEISEILNFHPIDLKFEVDLHVRSLNSILEIRTMSTFWPT